MLENILKPHNPDANLKNYAEMYKNFNWEDVSKEFSWHETGKLNIAYEAIDRHAENPARAGLHCLIYFQDNRKEKITYKQMRELSNKFANVLRGLGVKKGDRIFLLLPRIPELYTAMVGCAKIGAIIANLYSDYREGAVKERMLDGEGTIIVTTPVHLPRIPVNALPDLEYVILVDAKDHELKEGEISWDTEMAKASSDFAIEWVVKDFPLFLSYTSGAVGKPIGLLLPHDSMRGYYVSSRWVLDLKDGDVLWTQARTGWLMNVIYSAFAPWLCGVENFITGKIETVEQLYQYIEEARVSVLYAIPTIHRMIQDAGEETAKKYNLKSLRHMLSALEPLTPELIYGILRILGIAVHDTWWTAETGMITIANFPSLPIKPGYLGKPLPGIYAAILDKRGKELPPYTMGELALKAGWPSMVRGVWKDEERYQQYFAKKSWFASGDTAFKDFKDYFYYQGRADDVIITPSGRIGPAEIENALNSHPAVAEAGVIRVPNEAGIKTIKAYVCLKSRYQPSNQLKKKIMAYVENCLSPGISPKEIEFCDSLPKTKSGKVLRRVLKAWELGLPTGNIAKLRDE
jgi:acetyl-CoA synthetase